MAVLVPKKCHNFKISLMCNPLSWRKSLPIRVIPWPTDPSLETEKQNAKAIVIAKAAIHPARGNMLT